MLKLKLFWGRYKQLLPLIILLIYCIPTIIAAIQGTAVMANETYEFSLSAKQYFAFLALIINLIFFFRFRNYYKYVFLLTVIFGVFNFIVFSVFESTIGIKFGTSGISFQPSALLAGFVAYFVNFRKVNILIFDYLGASEKVTEQKAKERYLESVNKFKERYKDFSTEELNHIITENKFVSEAIFAAKQLLKERN